LHHGRRRRAGVRHLWRALAITDTNFESNRVAIRDALVTALRYALTLAVRPTIGDPDSLIAAYAETVADAIIAAANGEAIAVTERVADSLAVPKPDAEPESIADAINNIYGNARIKSKSEPNFDAFFAANRTVPKPDAECQVYVDSILSTDADRERGDGGRDREMEREFECCSDCSDSLKDQRERGLHHPDCKRADSKRDADDGRRDDKPATKLADLFQLHYDAHHGDHHTAEYPKSGTDEYQLLSVFGVLHSATNRTAGGCYVCNLARGSKPK
jgi:hypothetical protein